MGKSCGGVRRGGAHSGSSHVAGEFLDLILGAEVYWRHFGRLVAVGKKELSGELTWESGKCPGFRRPAIHHSWQLCPDPLGDLGWALLLWPWSVSIGKVI